MDCRNEFVKAEYEETIKTLRNWDSLFVNLISSSIITGGVGGVFALLNKESDNADMKLLLYLSISLISFLISGIVVAYICYVISVALNKIAVIRNIEKEFHLHGAYKGKQQNRKVYYIILFSFLVFVIGGNLILWVFLY